MSSIDAKTYRPHTGSLPAQVLAFFKHHPEEELHISDITIKFDVPTASVHAALKDAVSSDLLKRNNSLYSAGVSIGETLAVVVSSPRLLPVPKTGPRGYNSPRLNLDMAALIVETDVPVIPVNGVKGESKWEPLFNKFTEAGQSIAVPGKVKAALAAAIGIRNKLGKGKFRVAMTGADVARVWRIE